MQTLVQSVIQHLQREPDGGLPDGLTPDITRTLIRRANHKWLLFVFFHSAREPALVIKTPMRAGDRDRIEREHTHLNQLRDGNLRVPGLPPRHALVHTAFGPALALPFAPHSAPMHIVLSRPWVRYAPRRRRACLDRAADWLLTLQRQGLRPMDEAAAATACTNKMLTDEFRDLRQAIRDGAIPLTIQHGDYNPANILLHDGGCTVVDWEWMQWPGLPLVDLFNLALRSTMLRKQLGHAHDALPSFALLRDTFLTRSPESDFIRAWLPRYRQHLGISEAQAQALFRCFASFVVPSSLSTKEKDELRLEL
ncbi:MAG: hypothetical protein EOM20_17075 [Spartobacteria bacterium]|nr:hypothetical protein [Spartobacteria bacterium]